MTTFRKLPARYTPVVFSFFMAAIMAFVMSGVLVGVNTGIGPGFPGRVLHAYALTMPVAFGAVMAVRPLVLLLVSWTVAPPGAQPPDAR
ncbi:uncharacterized protein DUF2798 [Sphaerotilus hippei]|uniref:Uncharacterized protein DUF2798 n=1 Tax=Sphaerotilus hippei TaxID=744406 RepID=A0A318HAR2_9BURK|nr:DUF2798 domain-containing protein [Sphaerotilus hippei]PXW99352.1 uncharacterized protein DUF2798 [Sphaerotilus hippei]